MSVAWPGRIDLHPSLGGVSTALDGCRRISAHAKAARGGSSCLLLPSQGPFRQAQVFSAVFLCLDHPALPNETSVILQNEVSLIESHQN